MTDSNAGSIRRLNPPELGAPPGYSQVVDVRASRIIFIAGQTALDRDGALIGRNDFAAQADQVFRNLSAALQSVGCNASNLVKLTVFVRDIGNLLTYREARNRCLWHCHSARSARRHVGRGIEVIRIGFPDRDRSHCGYLKSGCSPDRAQRNPGPASPPSPRYFRLADRFRFGLGPGTNFLRSAMANERPAQTASSSGSS